MITRETVDGIVFGILASMVLILAFVLLSTEKENRELKETIRLYGTFVNQQFDNQKNALSHEVNLPDGQTLTVEVNYQTDYVLSPLQRDELAEEITKIHKKIIAEKRQEEWEEWDEYEDPPEKEDWSKSFE